MTDSVFTILLTHAAHHPPTPHQPCSIIPTAYATHQPQLYTCLWCALTATVYSAPQCTLLMSAPLSALTTLGSFTCAAQITAQSQQDQFRNGLPHFRLTAHLPTAAMARNQTACARTRAAHAVFRCAAAGHFTATLNPCMPAISPSDAKPRQSPQYLACADLPVQHPHAPAARPLLSQM